MSGRAARLVPRRVVVGVSGSVAAYKAPFLIRRLREAGHEVKAVATSAALRFIGESALAAVSGAPVSVGVFDDPASVEHIGVAEWAELVVVAPASADLLARVRAGRANDLLTATILSTTAPVVLAPAMHTQMWHNPATTDNVAVLRRRGLSVIDPDYGPLTGGGRGPGRLPAPERILSEALAVLDRADTADETGTDPGPGDCGAVRKIHPGAGLLRSRRVLVTAGGTREPLDPVRFLGNRSSGRQGCALAAAAAARGAEVTLVQAHVEQPVLKELPQRVRVLEAGTATQMEQVVRQAAREADVVIMAAAVADYRPAAAARTKIKKGRPTGGQDGPPQSLTLELVENPDILAGLVSSPPRQGQVVIGFAAETGDEDGDVLAHGAAKARRKGADLMAVNAVGTDRGFGDVPSAVVVLDSTGHEAGRAQGSKADVAEVLLDLAEQRLAQAGSADPVGPG